MRKGACVMGRPKGSKTKVKAEKLNMTVLNRAIANVADLAADASLFMRERAQLIQLQRQKFIDDEKFVREQTEAFIKKHGLDLADAALTGDVKAIDAIVDTISLTETKTNDGNEAGDAKPTDLGALFGGKYPDGK